jgi:TldD protein
VWDDGKLRSASFDVSQGFGLRAVAGEATGYAHASVLSEDAIRRASATVRAVHAGHSGTLAGPPAGTNRRLYDETNPLSEMPFADKVATLAAIDAYARSKDPRVRQVSVSIAGEWQAVQVMRGDGLRVGDVRPLVRVNVSVVVGEGDRQESGSHGTGGRVTYAQYLTEANWRAQVDEALRQALVNLGSVPAPCWGPAGRASCCTRPSATASRATSTARRPPPSPG